MLRQTIILLALIFCVASCSPTPPEQFFKAELHTRDDLFKSYGALLGAVDTLFSKLIPGSSEQKQGASGKQFSVTVNDFVHRLKAYGPNSKWEKKGNTWLLYAEAKDDLTGKVFTSQAQFDVDPASGKVTLTRYIGIDGEESQDLDKLLISVLFSTQ